jgi:hypothetical protein
VKPIASILPYWLQGPRYLVYMLLQSLLVLVALVVVLLVRSLASSEYRRSMVVLALAVVLYGATAGAVGCGGGANGRWQHGVYWPQKQKAACGSGEQSVPSPVLHPLVRAPNTIEYSYNPTAMHTPGS